MFVLSRGCRGTSPQIADSYELLIEENNIIDNREYTTKTKWLKELVLQSLPSVVCEKSLRKNEADLFYMKEKGDEVLDHVIKHIGESSHKLSDEKDDFASLRSIWHDQTDRDQTTVPGDFFWFLKWLLGGSRELSAKRDMAIDRIAITI